MLDTFPELSSWPPPEPSLGCREPPLRSAGSCRSTLINYRYNRLIRTESHLETKAVLVFLARPDVIDVEEQQRVSYLDERGNPRSHVFDLRVTFTTGRKVAYAVKPLATALRKDLRAQLARIAQFAPRSFADAVALIVERDVSGWKYNNAALLYSANLEPSDDEPAIAAVRAAISEGAATIGDAVRASKLQGRAFRSILRLIGRGELVLAEGEIAYASKIWWAAQ